MKLNCPECGSELALADVNVANDLALCRKCGKNFSYAEVSEVPVGEVNLDRPPKGVWFKRKPRGFEIGAHLRRSESFFLVPFTIAWTFGTTWMLYGKQFTSRQFHVWDSLFGLPFVAASVILILVTLFTVVGKMVVTVEDYRGTVFTGVGRLGYRRRFAWDQIKNIRLAVNGEANGKPAKEIRIHADKEVSFAWNMKAERQAYFLEKLREMRREHR